MNMEQSSNTDTRNIVDAEPSQSNMGVAVGKDSHASGNESFLFRMKGKVQKETECYTIKQVDDYLATTGLSGFALESERNRLIERLKTRLKVINEPDSNVLPSDTRVDALFDIGFSKYEKACELCEDTPVRCPAELKEKFCKIVERLLDAVPGVHLPKFVFGGDEIEFKFQDQYGITFSFVVDYQYPSTTYPLASFYYTGHNKPNLYARPIDDCDAKKALEFIDCMNPVQLLLGRLERINPYRR